MHQLHKKTKGAFLTLLLTLPLLFAGCGETGNYGYPSKVVLTKSGGSKEVKGNASPYLIEIHDYDGNGEVSKVFGAAGDSMIVSYQWATANSNLLPLPNSRVKAGRFMFTLPLWTPELKSK